MLFFMLLIVWHLLRIHGVRQQMPTKPIHDIAYLVPPIPDNGAFVDNFNKI